MKATFLSSTVALILLSVAPLSAQTLVQYQMGQAQPQVGDAINGAIGGSLTGNSGYTAFNANAAPTPNYATQPVLQVNPNGTNTTAADAFAANRFFSFTITVGTNVSDLDLTGLTFNAARGGAGTPRGFGIRVDTPTTMDELVQDTTTIGTVRPDFTAFSIPLSGFASLQNLTAGQVVTFEVATFTPSGVSIEFDDITILGTAVPEPGSALLALAGGAALLGRRRRG